MKVAAILVCAALIPGWVWVAMEFSRLFLNSKIERLGEKNLRRSWSKKEKSYIAE